MAQKDSGFRSGLFSGQDPINRPSGVGLELQQDIGRGRAHPQLVLGELGLRDSQYLPELDLCEVEASYFPDASSDRLEVGGNLLWASQNIRLTPTHISCILFSLRLRASRSRRALYTAQDRLGQPVLGHGTKTTSFTERNKGKCNRLAEQERT